MKRRFETSDVSFNALTLYRTCYPLRAESGARLPDDGIIDTIAIERFCDGDTTVRLTPRELVCVVSVCAGRGETDRFIAARFGRVDKCGLDWITQIRHRAGIAAAPCDYSGDYLAAIATSPSNRKRASARAIEASGYVKAAA